MYIDYNNSIKPTKDKGDKMRNNMFVLIILFSAVSISLIIARSFRVSQMPYGSNFACAGCHVNPDGGGVRNTFGLDVESIVSPGGSETFWNETLASLDSDGDEFTNGEELQDPNGLWIQGTSLPGDNALVTNPGDPDDFPAVTSVENLSVLPLLFKLNNNYPNPFNPSTNISFSISENTHVTLIIYNSLGEKVRNLVNLNYSPGIYNAVWNGRDDLGFEVNSGVYIYRIVADNFVDSKRMILMR